MTVRETLKRLTPVMGEERVKKLWQAYLASDATDRRELEQVLESYAARALEDNPANTQPGLFPPPSETICAGDLELGQALYGGQKRYSFGLRKHELLRHVGIYGSSGSGKSNAIALIIDGLMQHRIPFLLCDFKRTFRALIKEYPDMLIYTAGDNKTSPFHFNPLIPPPGINENVWTKKVIGALSHAYCQGAGSESLLVSAMSQAYADAMPSGRWPTFQDILQLLDNQPAKGRKGMWMDSARRAVSSLGDGAIADLFCPANSLDIGQLLTRPVLLELDLLNQAEQTFLSEVLLLWIIQYRMHNNPDRELLQHAIILEEAHHLLRSPPGMGDGSEPVIHIALREVRELGESVILATQNASVVPVAVFGNQATTLAFHTKHASDVRATAQGMLLRDESKDEIGRLPVGEAIVRIPRWTDPIHVSIKFRPIDKGKVSDAAIRKRMKFQPDSMDSRRFQSPLPERKPNSAVPVSDKKNTKPPESSSTQATSKPTHVSTPTTTPKEQEMKIAFSKPTELERSMFRDILTHPFDGVVRRITRIYTSRRKGTAALQSLEQRGLIKPAQIYTGSSLIKLFNLTKLGRALCHAKNIGPLPHVTEGGIEHRYWVHAISEKLKSKGWKTKTEHKVATDLIVDVHAQQNTRLLAALYETGKSHIKQNLTKTIKAGYKEIWICSCNPDVIKLARHLPKEQDKTIAIKFMSPLDI